MSSKAASQKATGPPHPCRSPALEPRTATRALHCSEATVPRGSSNRSTGKALRTLRAREERGVYTDPRDPLQPPTVGAQAEAAPLDSLGPEWGARVSVASQDWTQHTHGSILTTARLAEFKQLRGEKRKSSGNNATSIPAVLCVWPKAVVSIPFHSTVVVAHS